MSRLQELNKFIKTHRNKSIVVFHHLALIAGLIYYDFAWPYVLISILSGYIFFALFGHGGHLYISHRNYKDTWYNGAYAFLINLFTAAGGPFNFTVLHRHHHKYSDTDKDPHSPTHIGWWRVYLLLWKHVEISPVSVRDMARSKWLLFLHRNQVKIHFISVAILALIDPRLVLFGIAPSVVYTIHVNGLVNWLGHKNGVPRNIPELAWLTPLSWRHGDHHNH
jgi:stearoyl-CoA desaturase (delta-9 desaturase)